jgi:hypothetical protein
MFYQCANLSKMRVVSLLRRNVKRSEQACQEGQSLELKDFSAGQVERWTCISITPYFISF